MGKIRYIYMYNMGSVQHVNFVSWCIAYCWMERDGSKLKYLLRYNSWQLQLKQVRHNYILHVYV